MKNSLRKFANATMYSICYPCLLPRINRCIYVYDADDGLCDYSRHAAMCFIYNFISIVGDDNILHTTASPANNHLVVEVESSWLYRTWHGNLHGCITTSLDGIRSDRQGTGCRAQILKNRLYSMKSKTIKLQFQQAAIFIAQVEDVEEVGKVWTELPT